MPAAFAGRSVPTAVPMTLNSRLASSHHAAHTAELVDLVNISC